MIETLKMYFIKSVAILVTLASALPAKEEDLPFCDEISTTTSAAASATQSALPINGNSAYGYGSSTSETQTSAAPLATETGYQSIQSGALETFSFSSLSLLAVFLL